MPKCARQGADDFEAKFLPKANRRFVSRNDEIELHRTKSELARLSKTMLGHRTPNPPPLHLRRHHKGRIRYMCATASLIRSQNVSANNPIGT